MAFHIIDRESRRVLADLDTEEEAERRLAELRETTPGADLFIFSSGDDPPDPSPSGVEEMTETKVVVEPEAQLLDEVWRVRDTEA